MSRDQGLWGRLFVGNLPTNYAESDLRDLFKDYPSIKRVDAKRGYAYVYFSEMADAEDAASALHGKDVEGQPIKVENVTKQASSRDEGPRHDLRIRIHDLEPRTNWQDLKDWARNAGAVKYANVFTRGHLTLGVVEFTTEEAFESSFGILENLPINRTRVRITKEIDEKERDDEYRRTNGGDRSDDRGRRNDRGGGGGGGYGGGYDRDSYRNGSSGGGYDSTRDRGGSGYDRDNYRNGGGGRSSYPTTDYSRGGRDRDDRRPPIGGGGYGGRDRSRSRSRERAPRSGGYDRAPAYESRGGGSGYNSGGYDSNRGSSGGGYGRR